MINVPTLSWSVTLVDVFAAIVFFGVGYVSHELMHIGALKALQEPYTVEVLPDGLRGALVGGTGVNVRMQSAPARWRVAVVMLAPMVMAMPPLVAYAMALTYPVLELGTVLVLGAWFIAAIPSLHDVLTVMMYRPAEAVPAEVTT